MGNCFKKIIYLTILILVLNINFLLVNENNQNVVMAITSAPIKDNCTHVITKEVTTKDSTCTAVGSKNQVCTICNKTLKVIEIPKKAHNFVAKDCTSPERCTVCNTIGRPPTGHPGFSKPTCISPATCIRCGYKKGSKAAHNFVIEDCMKPERCTVCQAIGRLPKAHDFSIKATCATPRKCSVCGKYDGEPLGHIPIKEASCGEYEECKICGAKRGPIDHEFRFVKLDSTWHQELCSKCDYSKTMERHEFKNNKCEDCGYTKENCYHSYEWKVTEPPVCDEAGEESYVCIHCGNIKQTRRISKLGHSYNWKIIKEATCKETGIKSKICEMCGKEYQTIILPKKAHDYKKATCTEAKKCNNCGDTFGNALGHSYKYEKITGDTVYHNAICKRCEHEEKLEHTYNRYDRCTKCSFNNIVKIDDEVIKQETCKHKFAKATCTTPKKCSNCGDTFGNALGHSYKYEKITGDTVYHNAICKRCEHEEKLEHTYNRYDRCTKCSFNNIVKIDDEVIKQETCKHKFAKATCTTPKKCSICGIGEGFALGHLEKESQIKNDVEMHKVTCSRKNCDYERTEEHTYNKNNKCTECGFKKASSTDTGNNQTGGSKTESNQTGNNQGNNNTCKKHDYSWVIVEQATCENKGLKKQICSNCQDVQGTKEIALAKHSYTKATCQAPKTCSVCGNTTGKLGKHSYTKATCQAPKTCSICGSTTGSLANHKYNIKVGTSYDTTHHFTQYKCECGEMIAKNRVKHKLVNNVCSCGFVAECLHDSRTKTERVTKNEKEYILKTICVICNKVIKEEVKQIVINGSTKYSPNDFGQNKPVMNKDSYSDEDWARMEIELKERIEAAGYGTRAAVVEAALYLASLDYAVPYKGTPMQKDINLGTYPHIGLNKTWGDSVKLTRNVIANGKTYKKNSSYTNGMDCSAFVTWAFVNGGILPDGTKTSFGPKTNTYTNDNTCKLPEKMRKTLAGQTKAHALIEVADEVEPGDIALTYANRNGKNTWTHIGLVVGVDKENIYVAESNTTTYSQNEPENRKVVNKLVVTKVPKTYTGNVLGWIVLTDDKLYKAKNADGTENIGNMPIVWEN